MTSTTVSTLGVQLLTTKNLQAEQTLLSKLNEQLASGKKHVSLSDYAPSDVASLLNFQSGINQRQGYLSAMQTVSARLSMYDTTMSDIESIAGQAQTLAAGNQNFDASKLSQLNAQINAYLQQVQGDLNQQISGRYVYAGTRYSTAPVTDLTQLTAPTLPFTPLTNTAPYTLPDYDLQASSATASQAAWTQDSVTVDTNYSVTYGVTSNAQGFQEVIAGLRLLNDATKPGASAATYASNLTAAATLLGSGLTHVQSVHAGVAGSINTLTQETNLQNTDITNLQNQLSNIQQVDITQVGIQINILQSQLQASYSATAALIQESILKYL